MALARHWHGTGPAWRWPGMALARHWHGMALARHGTGPTLAWHWAGMAAPRHSQWRWAPGADVAAGCAHLQRTACDHERVRLCRGASKETKPPRKERKKQTNKQTIKQPDGDRMSARPSRAGTAVVRQHRDGRLLAEHTELLLHGAPHATVPRCGKVRLRMRAALVQATLATFTMQRTPCNVQHATHTTQRIPCTMQLPPCSMQRATCAAGRVGGCTCAAGRRVSSEASRT
jgi:hypothetical protein